MAERDPLYGGQISALLFGTPPASVLLTSALPLPNDPGRSVADPRSAGAREVVPNDHVFLSTPHPPWEGLPIHCSSGAAQSLGLLTCTASRIGWLASANLKLG
ncbi:hypothetical protein BV22DRAFT_1035036 [Leucogyrophana mollusca]|uniref:Uncharacterized protein n=1 Tax=Leucogyrophana mollusca TaxID=85980 RepID=A0ACB8BFP4_9AGAM|nr:hypothetical protein BV22DRAFT_1035036 [Leucogyrophana mollusca]